MLWQFCLLGVIDQSEIVTMVGDKYRTIPLKFFVSHRFKVLFLFLVCILGF